MGVSTMVVYGKIKTSFSMTINEHLLHARISLKVGGTNMIEDMVSAVKHLTA